MLHSNAILGRIFVKKLSVEKTKEGKKRKRDFSVIKKINFFMLNICSTRIIAVGLDRQGFR